MWRSCRKRAGGVIDRSKARDNPLMAMADSGRKAVWNSRRGNHLGQRSYASASTGRTYARKRSDQNICLNPLARGSRPHMPSANGRYWVGSCHSGLKSRLRRSLRQRRTSRPFIRIKIFDAVGIGGRKTEPAGPLMRALHGELGSSISKTRLG